MRLLAILACTAILGFGQLSGRRAPGFSLPDMNIHRYDPQDYRGKWLLIDFMKTDCPHCQALAKVLEQVKSHYGNRVAVFSIVIVPPENQSTVAAFIRQFKITYPILFDQGQVAASYFNMTPANNKFDTPHLFIIDPNGIIVKDFAQYEGQGLMKELDSLMTAHK
ncbi:MAG TPA: TlpA disulfide reductase family protein [Bryobacteraceae bacterium]|nr:TlpA disulfide reductase family protein [Bryobacteraceae bacterium]